MHFTLPLADAAVGGVFPEEIVVGGVGVSFDGTSIALYPVHQRGSRMYDTTPSTTDRGFARSCRRRAQLL